MKTIRKKGIRSHLDKYQGKWVAVTEDDQVIASGRSLQDILPYIKTKKPGQKTAYALYIPPKKGQIQL
ncbi:MAG: hypothetical protein GXP43_01330 [bacterium]|nr:hypothetical protein [bacterium]